jgi:uncharacterized membrane-anchored protein
MALPTRFALALALSSLFVVHGALATSNSKANAKAAPAPTASAAEEQEEAPAESSKPEQPVVPWKPGPLKVTLGHSLTMDLPGGDAYVAGEDAKKLLERNGNFHNENLLAVVVGTEEGSGWAVTIRYEEDGYVKDDEKLDADAILQSLKEGTNEGNAERAEKGFQPLTVNGWRELPRYDRASHHLVWGVDVASKDDVTVNYSTRILGRRGWVALNLLSDPQHVETDKPAVAKLLDVTTFDKGSRYEDHASGDKVAEYGLVGLVLGGAGVVALKAAKIGFLASFWKVIVAGLLAAKKAVIVGFAAVAAYFKRLFGRKPKERTDATPSA